MRRGERGDLSEAMCEARASKAMQGEGEREGEASKAKQGEARPHPMPPPMLTSPMHASDATPMPPRPRCSPPMSRTSGARSEALPPMQSCESLKVRPSARSENQKNWPEVLY